VFWDLRRGSWGLDLWFSCIYSEVSKLVLQKSLTLNWDWWIAKKWAFGDSHRDIRSFDLWFDCIYSEVSKLIWQKSLTLQRSDWWTLEHWVFWDLHWDLSCPDLSFSCSCLQVNKIIIQKAFYCLKLRLMDCKELRVWKLSRRYLRPWSVILLHLLGS